MKLLFSFLISLIPLAFSISSIPENWKHAESPLTQPIYSKILAKLHSQVLKISSTRQERITRGKTAKLGQIPYQILLYVSPDSSSSTYLCGGSIISSQWILTAAHCIYEMTNASVYAGVIDRVMGKPEWSAKISQSQLIPHESYNPTSTFNDIGLIGRVNITFGPYVKPIEIPTAKDAAVSLIRRLAEISGWGVTSDFGGTAQDLQYTQGPIVSNLKCASFFGWENVGDSHVCLDTKTGRSTCNGDSGGPLSVAINARHVLVGVVSFGSAFGCELGFPAAFTKVSSHLDWLKAKSGI